MLALCHQLIFKTPTAFRSTNLEAARTACPQLAANCTAQWGPRDTKFWHRCDDGWTVDSTTRGGWQGSRAMQVMFVLGLEFALSKSDELAPNEFTRIDLQDDMTFIGFAAALNRSWSTIEGALADAGHRLHSYKCRVWAPGFEQFEDAELPMEVRNLCFQSPAQAIWCEPPCVCSEHAAQHACRSGPTC